MTDALAIYLVGYVVALGYQIADEDFRVFDAIVCPLLWPACIIPQILIAMLRAIDAHRKTPA